MTRAAFANVAVPVTRRGGPVPARSQTFTYAVPPELADAVRPGVVATVPFGRRLLQGVVVELSATSAVDAVREIDAVRDPRAVLGQDLLALAIWMADHYTAPLFECLRAMVPPGTLAPVVRRYGRTKRGYRADELTPEAMAVLGAFGRDRVLDAETLARRAGVRRPERPIAALVAGGWLAPIEPKTSGGARPLRTRIARLVAPDPAEAERALRALRPKPGADVVALLRDCGPNGMPTDEVREAAQASSATIRRLVERELVRTVGDPERLVLRAHGARARQAEHGLRGTAKHLGVLDYLIAADGVAPWAEIGRATGASARVRDELVAAGLIDVADSRVWRDPVAMRSRRDTAPTPTSDQVAAWTALQPLLEPRPAVDLPLPATGEETPTVCLVHGVTGSGKTELYLRCIEHVLQQERRAVVLVPEIALTAQALDRYAARFPGRVGAWHSGLSDGERLDTWQRARDGALDVVVGSRSAVFAPLPDLGLIVIDEEHAGAYKQDRTPRYDARDAAIHRAALCGATVLLGSATPSVTTYWRSIAGPYRRVELPRRIATGGPEARWGPLPPVLVIDMRSELQAGNRSIFSRALSLALQETLEAGDQAILFLNRRGGATFVSCRDCGHVQECPRCSVPLTYHLAWRHMACHYCNHREMPPMMCPACGSTRIKQFGAGTERVEEEVGHRFPEARALRWDSDVTTGRGAHEAILARFAGGEADVLVGTQMIAKGLDLPGVTLVGVVSADTSLHMPDPWSRERTFQTLTQVAGRAGRSRRGGRVIFQTYRPADPAIRRAALHDYAGFYADEIRFRARGGYPPFRRLVRLELLSEGTEKAAEKEARRVADELRHAIETLGLAETDIVGPAPAFFHRLRGKRRWHVVIRSEDPYPLLASAALGPAWRVDVDPVSLL